MEFSQEDAFLLQKAVKGTLCKFLSLIPCVFPAKVCLARSVRKGVQELQEEWRKYREDVLAQTPQIPEELATQKVIKSSHTAYVVSASLLF